MYPPKAQQHAVRGSGRYLLSAREQLRAELREQLEREPTDEEIYDAGHPPIVNAMYGLESRSVEGNSSTTSTRAPGLFVNNVRLARLHGAAPTAHPYERIIGAIEPRKTLDERDRDRLFWPRTGGLLAELVDEVPEAVERGKGGVTGAGAVWRPTLSDVERAKQADRCTPVRVDRLDNVRWDRLTALVDGKEGNRRDPANVVATSLARSRSTNTVGHASKDGDGVRGGSGEACAGVAATDLINTEPPLSLTHSRLTPIQSAAARGFNKRHVELMKGAASFLATPPYPSLRTGVQFSLSLDEVRRNRLTLAETHDPFAEQLATRPSPPARASVLLQRRTWTLETSIWHPRKLLGNSTDYYETEEARRALFDADWALVRRVHGLTKKIEAMGSISQSEPPEQQDELESPEREQEKQEKQEPHIKRLPELGQGAAHVDAVRLALWRNCELIYGAYEYYSSCLMDAKERRMTAHGEYSAANHMSVHSYHTFGSDCGVADRVGPLVFDLIWHQVNTELPTTCRVAEGHNASRGEEMLKYNTRQILTRHEFVHAIVRLSMAAYIDADDVESIGREREGRARRTFPVAEAVEKLCANIDARCPTEVHQDSNAFRRLRCYHESVDKAFQQHAASLRRIFAVYALTNRDRDDELQRKFGLSLGEFLRFLRHVGLVDTSPITSHVTLEEAVLIFKWSIIRGGRAAADSSNLSARSRMCNLLFEDFLEALVRIACMIALPTEWELQEAGAEDAGEFLLTLHAVSLSKPDIAVELSFSPLHKQPQPLAVC